MGAWSGLIGATLALAACSDDGVQPQLPRAEHVDFVGLPDTLAAGDTVWLTLRARTLSGDSAAIPVQQSWSVTDSRVATIDSAGMLIASGEGRAVVRLDTKTGIHEQALYVQPVAQAAISVSIGRGVNCAIRADHRALCWGFAYPMDFETGNDSIPTPVPTDLRFDRIAVGNGLICALTPDGRPWCWGFYNYDGQLGTGVTSDEPGHRTPREVVGGHRFTEIVAGWETVCGLKADGSVWCWGSNHNGALGVGPGIQDSGEPLEVAGGVHFASIRMQDDTVCGVDESGRGYCWGRNSYGQVGDGTTTTRYVPTRVRSSARFKYIAPGWGNSGATALDSPHTCGFGAAGGLWCWGANNYGEVGTSAAQPQLTPAPITDGPTFLTVAAGGAYNCGLAGNYDMYCWGAISGLEKGTSSVPGRMSVPFRWKHVTAGLGLPCGISEENALYCLEPEDDAWRFRLMPLDG